MHTQLPQWVKTRIYRAATATAASPQSADMPRQALDLDQARDVGGQELLDRAVNRSGNPDRPNLSPPF
jgi:hypothetical protein